MLRINLLPPYVTQRRFTKRLLPFVVLGVVLSVILPLVWYGTMQKHLNDLTQQAETAEQAKTANDALEAQAVSTKAQVQPIQDKVDFAAAVHKYNRDQVQLINAVAQESPTGNAKLIYSGIAPGPGYQTMTIKAYSPSVETVGRYLQAMYQAPVFSSVTVDKIPGYPDNVQHRWYLGKTMVFADARRLRLQAAGVVAIPAGVGAATQAADVPVVIPAGVGAVPAGVRWHGQRPARLQRCQLGSERSQQCPSRRRPAAAGADRRPSCRRWHRRRRLSRRRWRRLSGRRRCGSGRRLQHKLSARSAGRCQPLRDPRRAGAHFEEQPCGSVRKVTHPQGL